jgi:hypothetical protein
MNCNDPCADGILINIDSSAQGPVGPPGPVADVINYEFVLMAGDTIISGTDNSAKEFTYNPDSLQVFINGVLLSETDYTATDGTSIILNEAAANNNDLAQITTQIPPEGYDPTNDFNRLQGQIDDNRNDIDGLRQDVDQNKQDIADLQTQTGTQTVTTADVMTVGALPFADPDADPKTQQEANWILHDWIKDSEKEIADARAEFQDLDKDVTNLTSKVSDLSDDVDGLTIAVATNTVNISKNASDIGQLQTDVGNITVPDLGPLDVRVTDLETVTADHDGKITDLRTDVDALGAPVDLGPLNDAISDNTVAIEQNTKDILGLKATDAKHTGEIADLQVSVGNLEAIDHDTSDFAKIKEDNQFTVSQTIQDGIKLTGADAFIEADTGTPVSFKNNNFSNPVINVMRSNGDVAISLEASGHIRRLATDPNDPTSAVNVEFVTDLVGGNDHLHDEYATKIELKTEETARILADQDLQNQIDGLTAYDDTGIKRDLQAETDARIAGDAALDAKIDALDLGDKLPPNLVDEDRLAEALQPYATEEYVTNAIDAIVIPSIEGLATEEYVDEGDAATLATANHYTDESVAGLASETFVIESIDAATIAITAEYTQAIADQAQIQEERDAGQDNEISKLENRVSQIESVSLDARYVFEGDGSIPRDGEFTILSGVEVALEWAAANGLIFSENAIEGSPEWDKVVEGDIIRLGGSTSSGIGPAVDSREADSFAEFKVTGRAGPASFNVELIRSASAPIDGVEYGVLLLSSFDPTGLATTDFVIESDAQTLSAANQYTDNKLTGYIPKTGGDVTGKLVFKSGAGIDGLSNSSMNGRSSCNIRVSTDRPLTIESGSTYKPVLKILRYEEQGGANSDRSYAPFAIHASGSMDAHHIHADGNVTVDKDLILAGGEAQQNVVAKKGFAGQLVYENTGELSNDQRLGWGLHNVWIYKPLNMQRNKIDNIADPDANDLQSAVTVNYLNQAIGQIDVGPDLTTLDARYLNLSSSSVQKVTGSVNFAYNGSTENKIRVGNNSYTSFFIPGNGHTAYFRGSVYANALEENGTTNHGGKKLATEEYADGKECPDATETVKGKAFLGQVIVGTITNPTLKQGQCYWNRSKNRLYIGT